MTSLSVLLAFPGAIPFMLGWVLRQATLEEGTLFLIQFFGNSPFLGNWLVLYEDYEKRGFYVANR
jgi:hypothetical protein